MTDQTESTSGDTAAETPQHPDVPEGQPSTEPRGNPPVDEEAREKGEETIERVKPY